MGRRLIFDTGVVAAWERRRLAWDLILEPDDDLGLSVVSLAELRAGVALSQADRRPRAERFLAELLRLVEVLPYDEQVIAHHARLLAWTHRHGVPRGGLDLVIAATTAATGRTLLTLDGRARFDQLPGVEARLLDY
ncbi:MAG: PIN domain-containing protein [Propionibacteriaceae bacterium]|jgi:predicted nucleic acid-binding protein|nr:PIN domain-containing protein [Propionibacteriaceae bacterium]